MFDCSTGGTFDPHKPIPIDGFDVWNTISRGDASPRTEILLNIDNGLPNGSTGLGEKFEGMALRMGSMKLMMNVPNITWFKPPELRGQLPDELIWLENGKEADKEIDEAYVDYLVSTLTLIINIF